MKVKDKILVASIYISVALMLLSACCVDSESWIPTIVFAVSTLYICLICIANDPYRKDKPKGRGKDYETYYKDDGIDII